MTPNHTDGAAVLAHPSLALDAAGRDLLFRGARSIRAFSDRPVPDALLAELWDLAKWPPTSSNCQPLRVVHVRTPEGKARLAPLLDERNRVKAASAPVTTILAADVRFHDDLPELFPVGPGLRETFEEAGPVFQAKQARFNASLQIGYFLLAARAVGLAVGPMAGFDDEAVTREFLDGDRVGALLLVNLGYPADTPPPPRLPRLPVDRVVGWA